MGIVHMVHPVAAVHLASPLDSSPRRRPASRARPRRASPAWLDPELARLLTEALSSRRGLELSLAVGEVVVTRLYDGDVAAWRLRSPKELSLRRMVREGRLPLTAAAMCRALGVYEVWTTAARGRDWANLSASHYRAVVGLPTEVQSALLEDAWRQQTTAQVLRLRAQQHGTARRGRGGRLPQDPIAQLVERVEREYSARSAADLAVPGRDLARPVAASLAARCEVLALRLSDLAAALRRR
jgi:hypothetical protein